MFLNYTPNIVRLSMNKGLIGFCGYARVGKDSAISSLAKLLNDMNSNIVIGKLGFADKLKDCLIECVQMCKEYGIDTDTDEFKEKFRPMWVEWSKVAKDTTNDEEIWVKCADKKVIKMQNSGKVVAICDVRYAYEIAYILKNGGQVVFIQRPGYTYKNDEEYKSFKLIEERYAELQSTNTINNDSSKDKLGKNVFELLTKRGFFDKLQNTTSLF